MTDDFGNMVQRYLDGEEEALSGILEVCNRYIQYKLGKYPHGYHDDLRSAAYEAIAVCLVRFQDEYEPERYGSRLAHDMALYMAVEHRFLTSQIDYTMYMADKYPDRHEAVTTMLSVDELSDFIPGDDSPEDLAVFLTAVEALSQDELIIVTMIDAGCTYREIGEYFGISHVAVLKRIRALRNKTVE